jgi:hypothetical protein
MSDLADYRMYDLRSVDWTASSNRTPSGVRVTADNSMACSAYTACIRVISDAVSSLPLHLFEKLPDGGKESRFRAIRSTVYCTRSQTRGRRLKSSAIG